LRFHRRMLKRFCWPLPCLTVFLDGTRRRPKNQNRLTQVVRILISVFDVVDLLKSDMIARASVEMIDSDQGMVTLSKRDIVIGVR